ncbi:hypothetical protein TSAR_013616 [Trichomalopsis sarcophagae]|uniref:Reverse transcriptase domain-containing protein n=1 Tax=Trichomalopsis sarcophagae TaxID=543379 RepID=A0A232F4F6_9HYME|nr:hypothetical protein TSAR_013616 [Trichomalopsis sarcophagae]
MIEERLLKSKSVADRALCWCFSYLSDRLHAVVDEGSDLPNMLKLLKRMIFVDDTQIYCHCSPGGLEQALSKVQAEAQAISDWAAINGLSLNLAKCKVMILGS